MATGPLAPVVRYLRRVTSPTASGDTPDAELLARFVRQRDEAAFTALVRRHGPMVLAVCRRLVRDGHAAEDAFQATFLILSRKAASLAQPELLGNWLYGVAYRTAMKARRDAAKRRVYESQAVRAQAVDPNDGIVEQELRTVLDEEINRLPQRYRVPVVLCYLQGQTNAEAARRLGCSRGTVATLLARARDKLRRRLTQRGIGLSVGITLGALPPVVRGGTVSLALENVTVKAAALLSAGQVQAAGALAAGAVALAKGVSRTMLIEKLKIPVAILVVTALVGTGAGVSAYRGAPQAELAESEQEAKPRPEHKTEGQHKPTVAFAELPQDQKATFRTANFLVAAPTKEIARQVGETSEQNRKVLARLWLGKELPAWDDPCPVRVTVSDKGSGVASEFSFQDGQVSRHGMFLQGTLDRIFADLLPHEMTHEILAEWRGRPLPRWADEGAAMLSESAISRANHEQAMAKLLRTGRPLPLSELLPNLDYPKNPEDVPAFYTQSLSLTDFLVSLGGRKKFLTFIARNDNWGKAAQSVYCYKSVEALEQAWLDHARKQLADIQAEERPSGKRPVRQEDQAAREDRQTKSRSAPSFNERLPKGPAPVQALAILEEDGRLTLCQKASYYQPVTKLVTPKDGPMGYATSYQEIQYESKAVYNFNSVRVSDAKGRQLDAKELRKRLMKETVVLISANTRPVDPLHLRLYKEDILVIVLPSPPPPPAVQGKAPLALPAVPAVAEPIPVDQAPPDAVPPPPVVAPKEIVPPSGP